jgi:hypothetical protein
MKVDYEVNRVDLGVAKLGRINKNHSTGAWRKKKSKSRPDLGKTFRRRNPFIDGMILQQQVVDTLEIAAILRLCL